MWDRKAPIPSPLPGTSEEHPHRGVGNDRRCPLAGERSILVTTSDGFDQGQTRDPAWERDELLLICEVLRQNDWKPIRATCPQAIELSMTLRALPLHSAGVRTPKFRSPASIQRKAADILTRIPGYQGAQTKGGRLDREVLEFFMDQPGIAATAAETLRAIPKDELAEPLSGGSLEEFEEEAPEGRLLYRRHRVYERSRSLRLSRIRSALHTEEGLACQVCRFDFARVYGSIGEGYIQVHHVVPLHESGHVQTRLADLALLCANCHVMAHRVRPWPSVVELRSLVNPRS